MNCRILALGDLHFRPHWFQYVARVAGEGTYDAVCLTGDFLDMHPRAKVSLEQQAEWVLDWFEKLPTGRTKVFAVSGNHDFFEGDCPSAEARWLQRARRPGVAVDGDIVALGGMNVVCRPWIGEMDEMVDGPALVLAHAPPDGTDLARSKGWDAGGDFSTRVVAEKLRDGSGIVLSGHVHEADAWIDFVGDVACFNPGCDFGARIPNRVVIDAGNRRAQLHNAEGAHNLLRF